MSMGVKLRIFILMSLIIGVATAAEQERPIGNAREQFPGTWELLSVERLNAEGNWVSTAGGLSGKSIGMLMYDEVGHMSVHIMNPDRVTYPSAWSTLTADQLRDTIRGYVAYFGTYEVNEGESYVVHHRRGHLSPSQVGVDAKRFFEFSGDRLTLYVAPSRNLRLTWRRIEN